jgi:hypothetical protein
MRNPEETEYKVNARNHVRWEIAFLLLTHRGNMLFS